MSSSSPVCATLLLAGGRSQRMGTDKALLSWRGSPLWQVQLGKLLELESHHCFVSCREEQNLHVGCPDAKVTWLFDPENDENGPLGAISRALSSVSVPLIVLAVDMPLMTLDFLRARLERSRECGCFFSTVHGIEPMTGCYASAMLPVMERRLARGERSLQKLITECVEQGLAQVKPLTAEEEGLFANANTPGEWQDCQLFKERLG
ncbi:MAG: molybdenum cofactor guanylyltransferase [Verrucomicrobiota bacterium]